MKYLITTISLFVSFVVSSQVDLTYHIMSTPCSNLVDSLDIFYYTLAQRANINNLYDEISPEDSLKFLEYHNYNLEFVPNEYSETYILDEYMEMFGGKTILIDTFTGWEMSTGYDEVIAHSDIIVDDKMIRIVETKTETNYEGTYYFFNTRIFIMDVNGIWSEVK